MLPLGYNILAMFIGLLLVNWVESIVMIMLKQKETLSKMAAYVTMAGEIVHYPIIYFRPCRSISLSPA
jgi:hypothetical protein